MGTVIHLAQTRPSKETIEVLTALLSEARAGKIIGLAYVAVHKQAEFSADLTGTAKTSPLLTLGMLEILKRRVGD